MISVHIPLTPGRRLAEKLGELNWTQVELSLRTGITTKRISTMVNGQAPFTPETSVVLSRALNTEPGFWALAWTEWRVREIVEKEKRAAHAATRRGK